MRWRDRVLSDPGFQRRSLRWPIARTIARRRMRALFDLCSGFVYSQVLLACVRLRVFEKLAERPRGAEALARELDLPRDSVERLMIAAESLDLVETRAGLYALGPLGAALLGNPAVALMVEHHSDFYADLHDPVALLRDRAQTTRLQQFWAYAATDSPSGLAGDATREYTRLMETSQALIADQVLRAYPVRRHRRLLDVGGGSGAFALAALDRAPQLEVEVFDLPSVAERAGERFERRGVAARAKATGGNFLEDAIPEGFDLVSLVRIVHDHDDQAVMKLLRGIRASIAPGGVLLIAEPMLGARGAAPVTAAYFGFYLKAMGQGRPRAPEAVESLLRGAGFGSVNRHRTAAPLLVNVLSARA